MLSREAEPASPAEWARHFSALLEAAGFPGERALDSEEFQTRAKWHEMLGELSKLERIAVQFSFQQAFGFLERLCEATLFQPESPDAPIQVLGVLESAGLRFDCLWVSGLTDEAWPLTARPNPFIPIAAQKKAGIPQASAEASAALDKRLTDEWKRAAAEVVFSWPAKDKDKDLAPSPLITDIQMVVPAQAGIQFDFPRYRDLIFSARKLETFEDRKAPPVSPGKVRGGTRVLADQAACPFRAFAKWRLSAVELEEPESGLDPRDRGKLLHALMREIWTRLKDSNSLNNDTAVAISQSADAAVKEMGLEGRFAELERERLAKLAREWLDIERRRAPFRVAAVEEKREINVAGLKFESRIDRMDELGRWRARAHRLQELAHAHAEAVGRTAARRPAAAAVRSRRARGPRRRGVRQDAPGRDALHGLFESRARAAPSRGLPRLAEAARHLEARRRCARQVLRHRRGAGRSQGRPEDLPHVRAAHALPRLREVGIAAEEGT